MEKGKLTVKKETIGGYYDLVSRARKVGLPDTAIEKDVKAMEDSIALKLPSDHPSNQKKK